MVQYFGDSALSRATVFNQFAEFTCGRQSPKDELRCVRLPTVLADENIAAMKNLINENHHITYGKIEVTLKIGFTAAKIIIEDHLSLTKRCIRWIPHLLTPKKKDERVEQWQFRREQTKDFF